MLELVVVDVTDVRGSLLQELLYIVCRDEKHDFMSVRVGVLAHEDVRLRECHLDVLGDGLNRGQSSFVRRILARFLKLRVEQPRQADARLVDFLIRIGDFSYP